MSPLALANLILIFHALFISMVVFSMPLIILGGICKWKWVHNPWFRIGHLCMIGFVALEALIGMHCPLTVWESNLRKTGGEAPYGENGYIATWLHKLLFYSFPHWMFTLIYVGFGLLVLSLFYFVPLRRR